MFVQIHYSKWDSLWLFLLLHNYMDFIRNIHCIIKANSTFRVIIYLNYSVLQGGITIKKFNELKKPLNKAFLTLIAVSVVIPFFALNPVSAEEPASDFSTEPGTEFYVSEFEKNDDIDLFGNEDIEVLMEQLDEEEIVLEEDALIENVENEVQDEEKIDEISLYKPQFQIFSMASNVEIEPKNNLTMGFLQPTAGTGVNGNIFDGSQSSTVLSYIAADVRYTGVIPFVEKKDGRYRILISGLDGWVDEKGFRAYAVDTTESVIQ